MKYEKGQAVRFIRNSRTHLVPPKGVILDSDPQWEPATYDRKEPGQCWHWVDGPENRQWVVPSRRLRPVKAEVRGGL